VRHVRQYRIVTSAGELAGRPFRASCRSVGNERYSLVDFADGRRGLAAWRRARMFGKRTRFLGPLADEILMAGCAGQVDSMLAREVRLAFESGRPLRLVPAIFRRAPAYRVRISRKPRLVYLFVDRERLVPVGLALRGSVSGTVALDAREPLDVHHR